MSSFLDNQSPFLTPRVDQYNSHQVMTNVFKPTKKKYININTEFCDEYFTNQSNKSNTNTYNLSSYTITLPEKINDVKSMSIKNIELPVTYYNISAQLKNNALKIKNQTLSRVISKVIIIPDGYYTILQLKTALDSILTSTWTASDKINFGIGNSIDSTGTNLSNQSTTSYQSNYYSFFYITENTNYFQIDFAINSDDGTFNKYNFKSSLGWLLGFRNYTYIISGTSPSTPGYTTTQKTGYLLSENNISLSGPKYFYLAIDEFSKGTQNSFLATMPFSVINKKIIAKITLNTQIYPFGTILPANIYDGYLMSDKREYNGKTDIQKLLVQLIDEYGNFVNLNGADFSFCVELEYE